MGIEASAWAHNFSTSTSDFAKCDYPNRWGHGYGLHLESVTQDFLHRQQRYQEGSLDHTDSEVQNFAHLRKLWKSVIFTKLTDASGVMEDAAGISKHRLLLLLSQLTSWNYANSSSADRYFKTVYIAAICTLCRLPQFCYWNKIFKHTHTRTHTQYVSTSQARDMHWVCQEIYFKQSYCTWLSGCSGCVLLKLQQQVVHRK